MPVAILTGVEINDLERLFAIAKNATPRASLPPFIPAAFVEALSKCLLAPLNTAINVALPTKNGTIPMVKNS